MRLPIMWTFKECTVKTVKRGLKMRTTGKRAFGPRWISNKTAPWYGQSGRYPRTNCGRLYGRRVIPRAAYSRSAVKRKEGGCRMDWNVSGHLIHILSNLALTAGVCALVFGCKRWTGYALKNWNRKKRKRCHGLKI